MMKDASKKRRDGLILIFKVWALDGKMVIKTSLTGEALTVYSLGDIEKLQYLVPELTRHYNISLIRLSFN